MEGIWKYCTKEQCRQFISSFRLFGDTQWPEETQIACLYAVSNHIEKHYHPAVIKKRDGSLRHLLVPDRLLMGIQKNILHHILYQLPVSSYATAYQKGVGILANAEPHVGAEQILKLDIQDFFGSILFPQVYQHAFPTVYFPPAAGVLLTSLCCYRDYLPQGAPTSAAISNLVMKPFDEYMGCWCEERGIRYSRYCDDMTFSGVFDAGLVTGKVSGFLSAMGFSLHRKKTQVVSRHKRQVVTGIVVNQKPQVSRDYRKRLRQEIYYCEKFGIEDHLKKMGDTRYLPQGEAGVGRYWLSLYGRVRYVLQVNPGDLYFQEAAKRVAALKI